jgi:protein MpaA
VRLPVLIVVLVAIGCASSSSSQSPMTESPSGTSVVGLTSTTTTSTTTTIAPTTTTTPTTIATTSSTSTTSSSTSSSTSTSTSSTSTSTSTTTTPPPVGQFACTPNGRAPSSWEVRPPSDISSPEVPGGWTAAVAGRSVQGRDIEVFVRAVDAPRRRVLVIGGLHGNEPVTPPAVRGLLDAAIAPDVEVWLVPVANPDGSAAGMRCNANGVDLNRNFAWEWRPDDGGPAPLSEPESQVLAELVEWVQPDVVIWVHQPLGYVSAIGVTSSALEQAWADAAGMPVRPDVTQHGGGESWSAFVAGVPSMLIEIAGWSATPELIADTRAGFEATLAALG